MQGFQDFCKRYMAQLVFAGLTLLVMLPLLKSGYVLSLDMVFTPQISVPQQISASYPFWLALHIVNLLIPSALIQKVLLFGILFASGWGMYWLMQQLRSRATQRETWQWGSYFAGILYMVNPFVYDRFMAGQYMILAGYAMLPFFVYALRQLYKNPSKRTALWLAGATTLTLVLSIHAVGPMILLVASMTAMVIVRQRNNTGWLKKVGKWLAVAAGITLLANSFWIIPAMVGKGSTASIIDGFTAADQHAFATDPGSLGLVGNTLALNGFWGESKNLFITAADTYSWWIVPVIALWVLVVAGIFFEWRRRKTVAIVGTLTILVALVLAVGTAGAFAAPLNKFLIDHVPFFAGYREPQKFVAVIVLAYAYFGGVAVAILTQELKSDKKLREHWQTAGVVLLLIPVLCAPLMPVGFHGQLRAADYPVEWYAVRDRLNAECTGDCKVLYLPWHLYMRYDFAGRVIANPAPKFFGSYIVSSTDPELAGAAAYSTSALQKTVISNILPQAEQGKNISELLKKQHIRFIVLAKENDYKRYAYLDKQQGLRVDLDTPSLKIYRVK